MLKKGGLEGFSCPSFPVGIGRGLRVVFFRVWSGVLG